MTRSADVAPHRSKRAGRSLLQPSFRNILAISGGAILFFTSVLYILDPPMPSASYFFRGEDFVFLLFFGVVLLFLSWTRLPVIAIDHLRLERNAPVVATILTVAAFGFALAGAYFCFQEFDVVRDELDANFDALIFRSGRLLAPLAPEWRSYVAAFRQPSFVLPVPGDVAWASSYLPGNAALRALASLFLGAPWTSPILLAIAVLALFGVGRRLWPDRPDASLVAVLLLTSSSQVLVNAMTSYAMTAHLACNLVWLWLFLRDDRPSHAAALAVGFLASGLHQLVFHPLFVAPFIVSSLFRGRWRLFAYYVCGYALICLFWVQYWSIAFWIEGIPSQAATGAGAPFFLERITSLLRNADLGAVFLMMGNIARYLAWQNPIALPLVVLSFGAIRRNESVARPLAGGVALAVLAFGVLLAQQGSGWGYRYLHGFLGSWSLLAGFGWLAVTRASSAIEQRAANAAFLLVTLLAAVVVAPLRVWQATAFERPYREAVALIERAPSDIVLIDRTHLMHGNGLVRNDPFLRNRPKILDLLFLEREQLKHLCQTYRVSILTEARALDLGIPYYATWRSWDEAREQKLKELRELSCGKEL